MNEPIVKSTPKLVESTLNKKAKMVITKDAYYKISYLCQKINSVEWSGWLMYKMTGDVSTPEEVVCTVYDIYPMDKGTGAATNYIFDPETVVDAFEANPDWMEKEYKIGHIHSHNTMNVFFSGTDMGELHDNAPNHDFYVSLIVNNKNEMTAKCAFVGTQTKKSSIISKFKNILGELITIPKEEDAEESVLFMIDFNIFLELDKKFCDRVDEISKPKPIENPYISRQGSSYFKPDEDSAYRRNWKTKESTYQWAENEYDGYYGEISWPKDSKALATSTKSKSKNTPLFTTPFTTLEVEKFIIMLAMLDVDAQPMTIDECFYSINKSYTDDPFETISTTYEEILEQQDLIISAYEAIAGKTFNRFSAIDIAEINYLLKSAINILEKRASTNKDFVSITLLEFIDDFMNLDPRITVEV